MATTFDEDRKARARAMSLGGAPGATAPEMFNKTAPGAMTGVAPKPAAAELAAPSTPSAPSVQGAGLGALMPDTQAVYKESGKAISDLTNQGRYGAAAGETARAALAYVPAVANDVLGKPVAALAGGAWDGTKQFLGLNDGVQPKTAPSVTPTASPAGPRAANVAQTKNPAANQGVAPVTAAPTATAVQPTVDTPAGNGYTDQGNGIYRKGNAFTDNPGDANFAARGAPTAQNMAALNNLAASQPGAQPGLGMGGREQAFSQLANLQQLSGKPGQQFVSSAGTDGRSQAMAQLANLQAMNAGDRQAQAQPAIAMSTQDRLGYSPEQARELLSQATTKQPGESRADFATRSGAVMKALGMETDERGNIRGNETQQRGQDVNANTANQDRSSRERMEGGRQSIDAGRLGLQAMETGANVQTAGIKNRAATALADLQQKYMDAKTPEEQQTILAKYNALAGNGGQKADVWGYAPGKPMVDAKNNIVDTTGVLYNKQTGETREVTKAGGQQSTAQPQYKQGQVYTDANGNRAIWDGQKFVAAQ